MLGDVTSRSPEEARTAFHALQERLPDLWRSIEEKPGHRHVSVVVPSLSLNKDELSKIHGVPFYEERLLFILMRLRHPRARVLYVTSEPVPSEIVDYYLQLLVGVPASHARERLKMMCLYDSSPRPLTEKILERPRVLSRMREFIGEPSRGYLTVFNSSELERDLSIELGIPLNGVDPDLLDWGTKSGSRKVFRAAGVELPEGFEDVASRDEVVRRLRDLREKRPGLRRAVIKLNESFAGAGNAIFTYPEELDDASIDEALEKLDWGTENESSEVFFWKIERIGGIVEELVEVEGMRSPSAQLRIAPTGEILLVSTHEQLLGGSTGQRYMGCSFPADGAYRSVLQREAMKVGAVLRDKGVISRFGVDFLTWKEDGRWRCSAIEINLRMGGTTFPFLALEFLTSGELSEEDGLFRTARGDERYYVATDALTSDRYRGLLPEDLIDLAIEDHLLFDPTTETGVLFHMIGALSEHGKLGLIAIGDSPEGARDLFDQTVRDLDRIGGDGSAKLDSGRELPSTVRRID